MNIRDLVNPDRIAKVIFESPAPLAVDPAATYVVWVEKGAEPSHNLVVHVYNDNGLLRSGEYRLTQIEALQLVVDLMGGVTV